MAEIYDIISKEQLQAMLRESKGAKIVTLTTITRPELKKDNPYSNVVKISRINGIVNFKYANAVNKQREREGKETDFKPQKRKWGTRLEGLPFVSHVNKEGKHKLYLEVKIEKVLSTEYKSDDGSVIDKKDIEPFMKKGSFGDYQGLDKEVVIKDYDVANIATIDIDGRGYIIRKDPE